MMGLVSISKNVRKLLGTTAKAIKKYKKTTLVGVGGLAVGTGGYVVGKTTGHTASGHGRRKIAADMTPKEKADQKYAIAMRYKEDGHPRKSSEYKSKAARAYKAAWEKKADLFSKYEGKVPESVLKSRRSLHEQMQGKPYKIKSQSLITKGKNMYDRYTVKTRKGTKTIDADLGTVSKFFNNQK
jgi:hypothetical protein